MPITEVTAIIHGLAPQYDDNEALAVLIPLAEQQLNASLCGQHLDYACALLTLHLLSGNEEGAPGGVSSLHSGGETVSFNITKDEGDLDSTHWGRKLKGLRRSLSPRIIMRGM